MIEFFFDCSSPWTYLAFHNIQPLAKEFGAEISWRPILVGGISAPAIRRAARYGDGFLPVGGGPPLPDPRSGSPTATA